MNLPYTIEDERLAHLKTKKDFEIVRKASRMFEEAANIWMERALKAEAKLKELENVHT